MHILSTFTWFCDIIIIQQNDGVIIINAQLTFEDLGIYSCKINNESTAICPIKTTKNGSTNIINFPIKPVKNNNLYPNFTSQGKPKAQPADSVKTLEEIEKIKKYFLDRKEYRNYCLFILGITTGYRIGDLLSLKFSHIFNKDYSFQRVIDVFERKTGKRRKMPISENIKEAITLYIRNIGFPSLNDYIFKSQKGENQPIGVSPARLIFVKMAKDLKLPYHCSTHFLRKTFAYWFLQIHKNDMTALATLQDILNHSSEKMTLRYCGIEQERKEHMLESLGNLW